MFELNFRLKKKMQGKEDETVLVCLVPELCYLTGLDDRLRKNFTIMRSLATHTKVAPMARVKALASYIDSVNSKVSYFSTHIFFLCFLISLFRQITKELRVSSRNGAFL